MFITVFLLWELFAKTIPNHKIFLVFSKKRNFFLRKRDREIGRTLYEKLKLNDQMFYYGASSHYDNTHTHTRKT